MRIYQIQNNSGMALLIVLWVLVLLSVMAAEFSYTMRNQVRVVNNFKEGAQAYYMAVGGINQAIFSILRTESRPPGDPKAEALQTGGATLTGQWRTNSIIGPIPFGEQGAIRVHIQNEGGKIDINQADEKLLNIMLEPFNLDESRKAIIVGSIQDWRDENSLHRANGAEDDYYQSLAEPYECRDGDFESKQELLLVRGISSALYYGGLQDFVTVISEDQQRDSGLGGLLSRFSNTGQSGGRSGKLNINAVPTRLLSALPDIQAETVEIIDSHRKKHNFNSLSELQPLLSDGQFQVIRRYLTADPLPYYRIWVTGYTQNNTQETVEALVKIQGAGDQKPYRILEWKDSVQE
ncbi:MAG: type II secretion system protein GspK [Desulfobacterales bacterium]|nr:type II secretion system protein GspK [Desulfobacterales bacterium]